MKEDKNKLEGRSELRRHAENALLERAPDSHTLSAEDTHRLLHELEVHQIELEMQNEELRRALQELEAARDRYVDLYDYAPVGYFTVGEDGRIAQVNHTGAVLLDMERDSLIGEPLSRFIVPEDQDVNYRHLKNISATRAQVTCEIQLIKADGVRFFARLESSWNRGIEGRPVGYRIILSDITERKHAEEALKHERDRAQQYLDAARVILVVIDADQRVSLINQKGCQVLGCEEDRIIGRNWFDHFIPESIRSQVKEYFERLIRGEVEPSKDHENPIVNLRGEERLIQWHNTVLRDKNSRITSTLSSGEDITERRRVEEQIQYRAYYDPLTELANRALFSEHLSMAIKGSHRKKTSTALLLIDLDRFKLVNDTLGHTLGDKLLQQTASRLWACIRENDTVARLGGDEFTVVLPDVAKAQDTATVAEKIIDCLTRPFLLEEHEVFAGASIGISIFPTDATDVTTMLKHADLAMYQAKKTGGNIYRFFTPELTVEAMEHMNMEKALREGLDRAEFMLYYQPIISLPSGRVTGAEALLRWNRPGQGVVMPDEFLMVAEDTGLIIPIGEWVLATACRDCKTWNDEGLGDGIRVAVNLSSREVKNGRYLRVVQNILQKSSLTPELLALEITESLLMDQTTDTVTTLRNLENMGIDILIDDFGTGYSSLSYLQRLPVDGLKIDRSFINTARHDSDAATLVDAIINMGHSLKLKVVAEGIETNQQLEFISARRCDLAQGYYYSKPVPLDDFTDLVTNWQIPC